MIRGEKMKHINQNELAKTVTLKEGKKQSISIGQVKEVMKILWIELAKEDIKAVEKMLKKYK